MQLCFSTTLFAYDLDDNAIQLDYASVVVSELRSFCDLDESHSQNGTVSWGYNPFQSRKLHNQQPVMGQRPSDSLLFSSCSLHP